MAQLELLQSASASEAQRKSDSAFKTISEVETELDVPQHVLRFWESHFPQVKPRRMNGSRRYYRPEDVDLLKKIKTLLYAQGYTIKGAKKLIKEKGLLIDAIDLESETIPAQTAPVKVLEVPRKKADKPDVKSLVSELRILKSMLATLL